MAPAGTGQTAISSKSIITNEHADLIFICQNCRGPDFVPAIFTSDLIDLAILRSDTDPEYIGNEVAAMIPLAGSERTDFRFDMRTARFSNFTAMMRSAGFS